MSDNSTEHVTFDETQPRVSVELSAQSALSLCGWQQGLPLLQHLRVVNVSGAPIGPTTLRIACTPAFVRPRTVHLEALGPGQALSLPAQPAELDLEEALHRTERGRGELHLRLDTAEGATPLWEARRPIELLPPGEWPGLGSPPELLACFVQPNHPALLPLIAATTERLQQQTGDGTLHGYAGGSVPRVLVQVEAACAALQAAGLALSAAPADAAEAGLRLRAPDELLAGRVGSPIDVTVLLCAIFEQIGLDAQLVLTAATALVGVWLEPRPQPAPVQDDPAALRTRIDQNELLIIDLSVVLAGGRLAAAVRAGAQQLQPAAPALLCAIDVAAARRAGVRPLPARLEAAAWQNSGPAGVSAEAELPQVRIAAPIAAAGGARDRIHRWADQLLDLSTRNRLISFKPGKASASLLCPDATALEDLLADGEDLKLMARPAGLTEAAAEAALSAGRLVAGDPMTERLRAQLSIHVVHTALGDAEHRARLLELYREERTTLQETGAGNLYVAIGALRWAAPGEPRPRSAPVLLVPVELLRDGTGPTATFRLRRREEEPRVNLSLLRFLEQTFGIDTRGLDLPPADDRGVDVARLLGELRRRIEGQRGWEVVEDAHLSRFSFAKLLMWMDLQERLEALVASPVVRHILDGGQTGLGWTQAPVDEQAIERDRGPGDPLLVREADPSQIKAIIAAEQGNSFVLEGPPGTGKSQTITNLIGHLLSLGKTVLFVSEKMAALSVVHHRLKQAGLERATLELHSNKANKKAVLDQLRGAFEPADAPSPERPAHQAVLAQQRAALNALAAELRSPTRAGMSVFQVLDGMIGLGDTQEAPAVLPPDGLPEGIGPWARAAERLERATAGMGPLHRHPLRLIGATAWSPRLAEQARERLTALQSALAEHEDAQAIALEHGLRLRAAPERAGRLGLSQALLDLTGALLEGPALPAETLEGLLRGRLSPAALAAEAEPALAQARAQAEALQTLRQSFKDSVLELNLDDLHARFASWARAFFLFAWLMLMGARGQLQRHAAGPLPNNLQIEAALALAQQVRRCRAAIEAATPAARARLGALWAGIDTRPDQVAAALRSTEGLPAQARALDGALGAPLGDAAATLAGLGADGAAGLSPAGAVGAAMIRLAEASAALRDAISAAEGILGLRTEALWGLSSAGARSAAVAEALAGLAGLRAWCGARAAEAEARALGMGPSLEGWWSTEGARPSLPPLVSRAALAAAWREAADDCPRLLALQIDEREAQVRRYRADEALLLQLNQAELVSRVAAFAPPLSAPGDQMALLRRQFSLQRGHMALRRLVRETRSTLLRLKPCVLMSPLSVAQYLDPSLPPFDVVIFDEASQIPPWDAIGAIARGKQVVIVGDSRQLPPTTFFGRGEGEDEPVEDDDIVDTESILTEARGAGLPALDLRWHYRSRHEALIAFSNERYYDGRLVTFPAPVAVAPRPTLPGQPAPTSKGVHWLPVPDGFYDRGGSRTNRAEAERVVSLVRALLAEPRPESVGIVTFSQPQQRLVEDLLDAARAEDSLLDAAFSESLDEPLFIKNLENVQGDERDVMIFSIGYGPDATGKVGMNFGPLNRRGGERRLNVAITRAKGRLYVVSTLRADQIDLSRTSARGVQDLRAFLDFAARGPAALDQRATGAAEANGALQARVRAGLEARGWRVREGVGVAGLRVPIAVLDPSDPERYLAGVLDDGPGWHRSEVAQERDRQRELVLGGLGWRFVRTWSHELLMEPEAELDRLHAALLRVKAEPAEAPAPPPPPKAAPKPAPPPPTASVPSPPGVGPWVEPAVDPAPPGLSLTAPEAGPHLQRQLQQLVAAAGPLTEDDLARRIIAAWGLSRLTVKPRQIIEDNVRQANLHVEQGSVWRDAAQAASWTGWRSSDPEQPAPREPGEIPLRERRNALLHLLGQGLDLRTEDLCRAAARVFGFALLGKQVRTALEEGIDALVEAGLAEREGDRVRART
jgi:hypothetical protein